MHYPKSSLKLSTWAICCSALLFSCGMALADDWPQWLGPQRDGVWRETDLVERFPPDGPTIRWRVPVAIGYSGPAVAAGKVYVTDLARHKDESGKPLRATRKGILGTERVLCLDSTDGRLLWQHEYDCAYTISYPSGPRTTPLVESGCVYTLGAMGDLKCLDATSGAVRWSKNLAQAYQQEPPVWGYAAHPLIDGDLLYCLVGGDGTAVVALNKNTGQETWRALSTTETGYSPPMIRELGGVRQLIVWLSEALYALDPATGRQLWKHDYPEGVPMQRPSVNIITVPQVGDMLFLSTYYHGPMMLKVDGDRGASLLWRGKSNNPARPDGAHCVMATAVFKQGCGYAVGCQGDLRAFKVESGEQLWESYAAVAGRKADCGTVFIVPQGDRYVMFNDQGDLILANLSPNGYEEIDRAHILDPVSAARGREIVWSHPAFAQRCVFARNDKELVCVSLAASGKES